MATAELTIDLDGTRALETNVSQHGGNPKSYRIFKDLVTDVAKRIVKRDGKGATLGSVAGTEIQAIHEYVYVDPTTGVETYHTIGAIDGGGYLYRWNGVTTWSAMTLPITPTAGGRWFFCNADNRVFACNGIDALLVGIQTAPTTITWRTAGVDAPSFAPTYSLTTTDPPVSDVTTTRTVAVTNGLPTVTASGGTPFVTGAPWVGKRMVINGIAYTILSVTSTTVLILTEGVKEATQSGLSWSVYPGIGDWDDIGPKYAFSYYNPTTGHASNPSPVLQVTETAQRGRTITVTIPGSAENTTAYNNGYTQIQLFRTAKNSGILVALNEKLTNNNAGTAITYVETATKFADTFLTDIEAPTKNRKPPAGLACLAFHQGRMWGMHINSGKLYFTPISVEIDFGVYAECWPALYSRTVAGMRGMVVVGSESSADSLVIQTSRGDFSIDGYDSITFAPYKLATRQTGGYLYGAASVDGDLCEFYADKRIYKMGRDLGRSIQDKLKLVKSSLISKVRLHWHANETWNLLLLSVPKGSASTAVDYTYVFDLDTFDDPASERQESIFEWNFGVSAFATVHNSSTLALELFAGDAAGAIYKLLTGGLQDAGANFTPTIRTDIFRFPEEKASLKYVKLFVNDAQLAGDGAHPLNTLWTGVLYLNEQTNSGAVDGTAIAMTFRQSTYRQQSAQGKELIFTLTASQRRKAKVFQVDITFPTANAALWIEKIVFGYDNALSAEAEKAA